MTAIPKNSNRKLKYQGVNLVLFYLGLFCTTSAFAEDYLAKLLPIIKSNLGIGSVAVGCIYLIAVYLSVRHFLETKNPMAFLSVVIVVAFLHFALPNLVFATA